MDTATGASAGTATHVIDVGLGTAYERVAIYRLFDRWLGPRQIRSAFEGPIDGMAGIAGLHLLGLARRGTRVTVALPDERALEVVRGVYRRLGVEDRLRLLRLGPDEPLPDERFDVVLTYNAVPLVEDWPGYLQRLAPLAARYLLVSVTNPFSYGVGIRRVQRLLERPGAPELFDHPAIRPGTLGPFLEAALGRIVEHEFLDCPWWPDLFVPTGLTLWEATVGRLPVAGRLAATWRARAERARQAASPAPRPHAYGPDHFPLFDDDPAHRDLAAALRRHPVFDDRGAWLGLLFGHHHAYLLERGSV